MPNSQIVSDSDCSQMREISPQTASEMLQGNGECVLLDIREPWELRISAIEGALHIPMQSVPDRLADLDPAVNVIVFCHHGARSRMVAHFLEQNGYPRVFNLQGGIEAWAREIDTNLATY